MISWITGTIQGRRLMAGVLIWLVPFLAAIPCYGPGGALVIDQMLFKSLMIVIGAFTAAALLVWSFRPVHESYAREAVLTGIIWLLMNWILDLIVLVGLLGMPLPEYITGIGLRYLVIPAMVIPAGIIADHVSGHS